MELWEYKGKLFKTGEEAQDWIATNEVYYGSDGLLSIFENELFCITSFEELLEFAEENGYTIEELVEYYDVRIEL